MLVQQKMPREFPLKCISYWANKYSSKPQLMPHEMQFTEMISRDRYYYY